MSSSGPRSERLVSTLASVQGLRFAAAELGRRLQRRRRRHPVLRRDSLGSTEDRPFNLEELVGVAREYDAAAQEPSLSGFLQEISLYSDQDALRDDADDGGQV